MKPFITKSKCISKGCMSCREICPMDIFRKSKTGRTIVLGRKAEDCIGCEECMASCPTNAIKIKKTRLMRT